MRNLWLECKGKKYISPFHETAFRIVETNDIATRKLVDSLKEQVILEELIEGLKHSPRSLQTFAEPSIKMRHLHPFLSIPFRSPPLQYSSRFGGKFEPSLWYGALKLSTAMAEKAFYQFNFLRASEANFEIVETSLTTFSVAVKADEGIKLIIPPFADFTSIISSPNSYEISQTLGTAMRNANIQAFIYQSARDPELGANIALFNSSAFLYSHPNKASFQSWQCLTHNNIAEFVRTSSMTRESFQFSVETFYKDGVLPFPAI